MLQDRILVAHNARFDYDFPAYEFTRARMRLPASQRLCTLALNRQVDPPTNDMKPGTLAAPYDVPRQRAPDALDAPDAPDALDDTRVLAGILRTSLREAARLNPPLPLVSCPPPRGIPIHAEAAQDAVRVPQSGADAPRRPAAAGHEDRDNQ
ncbi:hypothetical protein OG407_19450 [Streptomyces sp. NBC_01515]|uniref:hypothetical protein n=1 Tax=Streptomyces sp. NBC_01515 TaxID=2903890 RepID=UPI00386385A5